MGERGSQLLETADRQISRLICLCSQVDETVLRLPCPGREKLGDGTVGALASHTADSYLRIAAFVQQPTSPLRRGQAAIGSHGCFPPAATRLLAATPTAARTTARTTAATRPRTSASVA